MLGAGLSYFYYTPIMRAPDLVMKQRKFQNPLMA